MKNENVDLFQVIVGLRKFKANGDKFTINGVKTFLRGKHDGLNFPLTGFSPTTVNEWIRVLKISKSYGINHYRFHTCCPEYVPYIVPQEHGNHTKTKELCIGGLKFSSLGVNVSSNNQFEFNVSNYTSEVLTNAKHTDELIENENTIVRIDYKNSGIGSNSCGPELIDEYRLNEKDISFKFSISKFI